MDVDYNNCTMIVMDGIVFGPKVKTLDTNGLFIFVLVFQHCAQDGCIKDLINARCGAFCEQHEAEYGDRCRVHNCRQNKFDNTQACQQHQQEWQKYKLDHSQSSLAGMK